MRFKGCKQLDFNIDHYTCELIGISNHLGWERRDPGGNIKLCQFCKLRGRLNYPDACIGVKNAMCSHYEEKEYTL